MTTVGKLGFWVAMCAWALTGCSGEPSADAANEAHVGSVALAAVSVPTISTFTPAKAVQGATVTINGSGFVSGASVSFNGSSATSVTFVSASRVRAVVPAGATSGFITVTVPAGTAQSSTEFGVLPKVTSVTPLHAFAGDYVTVAGSGFSATTGVKFGTVVAAFDVTSDSTITASVPTGLTSGKVTVTTPTGSSSSTSSLLVLPLVSSFSPTLGPVGQSVSITGEGLSIASAVKFGTKPATFSVVSDLELTAVVPAGAASGRITVETPRGNRASSTSFTVVKVPSISSFTPTSAELPVTLTVNGANFVAVSAVKVGSVVLPSFTLVSSKQLTAPVPLGTPSGKISVTNAAGTATSSATFVAIPCSDVDADTVCDRDDICPGFDDRVDSDADGTPNGCDVCPSSASNGQSCGIGLACDFAGQCQERYCGEGTSGPGVRVGNVIIDGVNTAADLAQLQDIWCVTGNVEIKSTALSDLSSLSALRAVGGGLWIYYGNPQLGSLTGLENLRSIGAAFLLDEYSSDVGVASLLPLANLHTVEEIAINNAVRLTDLTGLERLTSLPELWLGGSVLTSLSGLQNLRELGWLRLQDSPLLSDISALAGISTMQHGFQFLNTGLASLHGFEGLTDVVGVSLAGNPNLTDLSPLSNLQSVLSLDLQGPNITSLAALSQIQNLEVLSFWDLGVTSLEDLTNLASVGRVMLSNNPALTSLSGLDGVMVTDLDLSQNPLLTDCGRPVFTADSDISLQSNPSLANIACLQGVTQLRSLSLSGNYLLASLEPLSSLTTVADGLAISNIQEIESLSGLRSLQSVGNLTIGGTSILNVDGLENLTHVGSLYLAYNYALRSLSGLSNLTQVDYSLGFQRNWNLSQCEIQWLQAQTGATIWINEENGEACAP